MYSTPSAFSDYQNQLDGPVRMIVELTDGTTTWYLSDTAMVLTDGAVHDLLISVSGISEKIFLPFSRKWAIGSVSLTLSNRLYQRVDGEGTFERLADQLTDVQFNTAKIYFMAGARATALSDCVTRFVGTVVDPIEYNADALKIKIVDKGTLNDALLPNTILGEEYATTPQENLTKRVPIVFGKYKIEDDSNPAVGGAVALLYDKNYNPKYIVAAHEIDALSQDYNMSGFFAEDLSALMDSTLSATAGGIATIATVQDATSEFVRATTKIRPLNQSPGKYNNTSVLAYESQTVDREKATENFAKCIDHNCDTYASSMDFDDDSEGGEQFTHSIFVWDNFDQSGVLSGNSDIGEIIAQEDTDTEYDFELLLSFCKGTTASWRDASAAFLHYESGADTITMMGGITVPAGDSFTTKQLHTISYSYVTDPPDWKDDYSWNFLDGSKTEASPSDLRPLIFILRAIRNSVANGGGIIPLADGVTFNQEIIRIYDIRMVVAHKLKKLGPMFAECQGYKYDSNITGRSSNYADGDCIEDPVGIVEWILRDYLSLADADLDLTSFINAENTSVKARINLHSGNKMTAYAAIRQLAEQSTFAFFFSGSGKARCIDLSDTSPTTNRTIPYSRIVPDSIKPHKSKGLGGKQVINHLTIESRYRQEYRQYMDIDVVEDSTSQTSYGTLKHSVRWPNVANDASDHVADFLVNSTDGLWSVRRNEIELQTKLFTNADLEIGDWIELDSTSVDPHIKCFGESWSGKQFMVTSLIQTMAGTKIKAIELW